MARTYTLDDHNLVHDAVYVENIGERFVLLYLDEPYDPVMLLHIESGETTCWDGARLHGGIELDGVHEDTHPDGRTGVVEMDKYEWSTFKAKENGVEDWIFKVRDEHNYPEDF